MRITFKQNIVTLLMLILAVNGWTQPITLAKPTPQQLAFQDSELGVFIHYSIDTYSTRGTSHGAMPAAAFNPTDLNAEQWILAAKAMGATYVVLTARHEEGFCLWPTKTTEYSVKFSPYKNGKGDIVQEFVKACRKNGLKVGLYTAPWIDSHWEASQPGYKGGNTGDINKLDNQALYDKALQKEKDQLHELLTNYGPISFIWDDHFGRSDVLDDVPHGGKFREFYATLTKYAHELQPKCLLLGPDIEHVGNENGRASYPFWNALNTLDGTNYSVSKTYKWNHDNSGDPLGKFYRPQLGCTTVSFSTGGWMWTGPRKPQPLERRMKAYYETIGRGSGFIVNLTPDRRGLIPDDLVAAAKEMRDEIKHRFGNPVASSVANDPVQTLRFNEPKTFDHVVTMEDLREGQKIAKYTIEAQVDGQWKTIVEGETIEHKRIDQFVPITATAMRFSVTKSIVQPAVMRSIAVFNTTGVTGNQMTVYPAPKGVAQNDDFSVKVRLPGQEWKDLDEYMIKVDEVRGTDHLPQNSSMAIFDFNGKVEVSVTSNHGEIKSARIRPLSYGITPDMNGNTLTFSLTQPRNLSVEVNGDIFHNLHLFANPIETNRPEPKDTNVIYYGPGIHNVTYGVLKVPSGKTVYLAGGAVLRGQILIKNVENVLVMGRGVIDQSIGHGLRIDNSRNIKIEGIFGSQFFTGGSRNVSIRNVKCISYIRWGDGMNVICSNDVLIDGVFNRNSDDCFTVYDSRQGFTGSARNIIVQNSTLWADVAHPILIGTHGNTPNPETLGDIRFLNIDILDHKEQQIVYQGCMSLNAGDSNLITNVRFENIRVEDFRMGQLVNLRVFYNTQYCTSPCRGIENIYFKDITYNGSHANMSIIAGYDAERKIKNVIFENLKINGSLISDKMVKPTWYKTTDMANFFKGEHVDGLEFRVSSSQVKK